MRPPKTTKTLNVFHVFSPWTWPKVVGMNVIWVCRAWQHFSKIRAPGRIIGKSCEYFDCAPVTSQTRSCGTKDKITLKLSHLHTNHIERLCACRAAFRNYIGVALAELLDLLHAFSEAFAWPTILLFPHVLLGGKSSVFVCFKWGAFFFLILLGLVFFWGG